MSTLGRSASSQLRMGSTVLTPRYAMLKSSRKMRQSRSVMSARAFSLQCFSPCRQGHTGCRVQGAVTFRHVRQGLPTPVLLNLQAGPCRVQGAGYRVHTGFSHAPSCPPELSHTSVSQPADRATQGAGFRDQGIGCRVQGAEFMVQGSGIRVQGACRVQSRPALSCLPDPTHTSDPQPVSNGAGYRVQGASHTCRVQGSGPPFHHPVRTLQSTPCPPHHASTLKPLPVRGPPSQPRPYPPPPALSPKTTDSLPSPQPLTIK